ncbi:MAG: hypothetical protein OXU20_16675 [Myxococcales bacterium]|nr:hypothetical protein [Myxococcales bacterium]
MSLSMQLLGGLLSQRAGAVEDGPLVGDELADAAEGPVDLELSDDVDQVGARLDADSATGLHESVGACESLCSLGGTGEEIRFGRFWQRDFPNACSRRRSWSFRHFPRRTAVNSTDRRFLLRE